MIVDLLPTEDQQAIRDSVVGTITRRLPLARLHDERAFGGAAEAACWDELAGLGLFGLGLAEADGGVGYTIAEEVTVARELGKCLVSPTVLATMLAAHVAEGEVRAALTDGSARAAFANLIPAFESSDQPCQAQLLDCGDAAYAVVWSDDAGALYRVRDKGPALAAMDEVVSLHRANLDEADLVTRHAGPSTAERAGALIAAYLTGVADAALAASVSYAQVREQFGQPIGAFQAIKHYCAEMARRHEAAVSQTFYAALMMLAAPDEGGYEVACARLIAAEAAVENARFNIQIHGGMGFTYEADAHFLLKRALLMSQINSGERAEQSRIMTTPRPLD